MGHRVEENIDPESEIGQSLTSLLSLLQGLHNGLDTLGGRQKRDISKILHKTLDLTYILYSMNFSGCASVNGIIREYNSLVDATPLFK